MAKKIFPQTIESEKVDIFKDEATNSIILVGKSDNTRRMVKYIKQLDLKGESTTQKMYVIILQIIHLQMLERERITFLANGEFAIIKLNGETRQVTAKLGIMIVIQI